MRDLELFYINRRKNELRTNFVTEQSSFSKGTIKENQYKQTIVALNARQSELMRFENFSKNIEGANARNILEICDSLLAEENKRLKELIKESEDFMEENKKLFRENEQLKKSLKGQSRKITELIEKVRMQKC
jgi:hypothetical protein